VSAGTTCPDLFARDDFTGTIQQHYQKVEGWACWTYGRRGAITGVEVRSKTTEKITLG